MAGKLVHVEFPARDTKRGCKDPEGNEFSLYQRDPSGAPSH